MQSTTGLDLSVQVTAVERHELILFRQQSFCPDVKYQPCLTDCMLRACGKRGAGSCCPFFPSAAWQEQHCLRRTCEDGAQCPDFPTQDEFQRNYLHQETQQGQTTGKHQIILLSIGSTSWHTFGLCQLEFPLTPGQHGSGISIAKHHSSQAIWMQPLCFGGMSKLKCIHTS